jgi:hypothetical protein
MTISKSPQRNSFQKESYLSRRAEEGKTPENDEEVRALAEFYDSWNTEVDRRESDPEWAENNMEYDLRTNDWILAKVRSSEAYAQNLYAAMCNNEFQKNDFLPRLKDQKWSCSWRYAGGIIADMREQGDYIDWYCSGIQHGDDIDETALKERLSAEDWQRYEAGKYYVSESHVTEEIEADLKKLGWYVIKDNHDPIV